MDPENIEQISLCSREKLFNKEESMLLDRIVKERIDTHGFSEEGNMLYMGIAKQNHYRRRSARCVSELVLDSTYLESLLDELYVGSHSAADRLCTDTSELKGFRHVSIEDRNGFDVDGNGTFEGGFDVDMTADTLNLDASLVVFFLYQAAGSRELFFSLVEQHKTSRFDGRVWWSRKYDEWLLGCENLGWIQEFMYNGDSVEYLVERKLWLEGV